MVLKVPRRGHVRAGPVLLLQSRNAQMIGHMRHGSPPRLMALQSILSPNRRESLPAPSAGVRMTDRPAVTLMAGFGPARLGLLALLLAIGRGWLGGGARGLLRSLQPQHQLDQLVLAQTLKLAAPHPTREPAISAPRKGLSNYSSAA